MAATVDEGRLEALMGRAVADMGAAVSAPLLLIGERLGLYKAMAGAGPLTPSEVALRAGASERYVREWLANQAAGSGSSGPGTPPTWCRSGSRRSTASWRTSSAAPAWPTSAAGTAPRRR